MQFIYWLLVFSSLIFSSSQFIPFNDRKVFSDEPKKVYADRYSSVFGLETLRL